MKVLGNSKRDTNQVRVLAELSRKFRDSDIERSKIYGEQSLSLAKTLKDDRGIATALTRLGHIEMLKGNYSNELHFYHEALPIWEKLGDSIWISECYNLMGSLYNNLGIYEKAMENHFRALRIRRSIGMQKGIAGSLNNIGNIYLALENWEKAKSFYDSALVINKKIKNEVSEANNLSNIGQALCGMGMHRDAISYHNQAKNIRIQIRNEIGVAGSEIYLGGCFFHLGKSDSAMAYLLSGKKIAEAQGAKKQVRDACEILSLVYENAGNLDSALYYMHRYLGLKDSLEGIETSGRITEAYLEFEKVQQLREDSLKNRNQLLEKQTEEERQKRKNLLFGIIVFTVLMVAGLFFLLFQSRRNTAIILEREVKVRTEELARFVYQSSHDMRSPLTSIIGLVDIALSQTTKEQQEHFVKLIGDRTRHLDGIYSNLVEFMTIRERVPIFKDTNLAEQVSMAISYVTEKKEGSPMPFQINIPQGLILKTDEFLLSVILKQVLLNAVYFCDNPTPVCEISGTRFGGEFVLTISDNGSGVPESFRDKIFGMFSRGSNKSKGSGLGLYISKAAAEKLGGTIRLVPPGEGAKFELKIPIFG